MKQCTKCKLFKEKSEFFKDKQKKDGLYSQCKDCNMKTSSIWNKNNPQKRKDNVLKCGTGLTRTQYLEILESQNECCAICGKHKSQDIKNLSVDHCHETNIIRGLLCFKCNMGLGYFCDNEEILNRAIYYLNNNLSFKNLKWKQKN